MAANLQRENIGLESAMAPNCSVVGVLSVKEKVAEIVCHSDIPGSLRKISCWGF
jgi:hypothetical protein